MWAELVICNLKIKKIWMKLSYCLRTLNTAGHGSKSIAGFILAVGRENFPGLCRSADVAMD